MYIHTYNPFLENVCTYDIDKWMTFNFSSATDGCFDFEIFYRPKLAGFFVQNMYVLLFIRKFGTIKLVFKKTIKRKLC
jgi:hypothetical protein